MSDDCKCKCIAVTVEPEAGTTVEVVEQVTLPVVEVCVPGIQGPKGDPGQDGKDGVSFIDPIPDFMIDNLF